MSELRDMRSWGHRQGRGGWRRGLCPPLYHTVDLMALTDKDNKVSDTKGYMKLWFKHDKRRATSLYPSICSRFVWEKARRCKAREREREKLTEHRSSVERLSPLIIPFLYSSALQHAVSPQLGSCCAVQHRRQGFVAVQAVSKFPHESCMCVDHSAQLHADTLIHCLPLGSNMVYLMSSPLALFLWRRV